SLYLYIGSPALQFKPAGDHPTLNMEIQARGLMDASEVRISALKIKADESFLVASGILNGDFCNAHINAGRLSMRTHVALDNIANWLRVLPQPPEMPRMAGTVSVNSEILYKGPNEKPELSLNLETKEVVIDK